MKSHLLSIADDTLKLAEALGAHQAEAYVSYSRSFSIDVENNAIKTAAERRDGGCGIRCIIDKKIGFAYVTTLEKRDIEDAVQKAVKLSKVSVPDPDFVSLPEAPDSYPEVGGLFDKEMEDLSSERAADIIISSIDAAKEVLDGTRYAIEARLNASSTVRAIANSIGVTGSYRSTIGYVYTSPTIRQDDEQTSSYEYDISRSLSKLDPVSVGQKSAENALRNLGARTIEGGDMPVVFGPMASGTLFGVGLGGAVDAEEVQYGRSYISDAFGDEIASQELEVIDDALMSERSGSRPFDAEGGISKRTSILENGVLKSLLHNSYTANKDEVENTGNASRPSYSGLPSISTTNLVISPGNGSLDDLVAEIDRGVLCCNTGDRPNMTTGDLSAMIMEGFLIENGEIRYPLKNTLIGINMKELLKRVIRVGSDSRDTVGAITPSIVIESARVTSG